MNNKIRSLAAFILLAAITLFSLYSCSDGEPAETGSVSSDAEILLAAPSFMHSVTDENVRSAISAHANGGINVRVKLGDVISFRVGGISSVRNYSVPRLAPVDVYDPDAELTSYTDTYIPLEYDRESGVFTLPVDWWYDSTGWVSENDVWGIIIRIEDEGGDAAFYYFRVIFE